MEVHYVVTDAATALLTKGDTVYTTSWQGKSGEEYNTLELLGYTLEYRIPFFMEDLRDQIHPNLPWAEDHFLERVGGVPLNPGIQYKNWPYYKEERGMREVPGEEPLFSHTYMERFWCPSKPGIRYAWGNLDNVVNLLKLDPYTRQAYLPVWFPEDTGAGGGVTRRVPCTLGYHFLIREGELNIFYNIRSCDLLRHFQDDIYLACRLAGWVLRKLWNLGVTCCQRPGTLYMYINSLHIFKEDIPTLKYRLERKLL